MRLFMVQKGLEKLKKARFVSSVKATGAFSCCEWDTAVQVDGLVFCNLANVLPEPLSCLALEIFWRMRL
jgi:hypothetical protein